VRRSLKFSFLARQRREVFDDALIAELELRQTTRIVDAIVATALLILKS
jgi:hypothetical protein